MNTTVSPSPAVQAGKFLTVVLDDEAYGLAVLKVREIIRLQKITAVPQMPPFVKGVINLRGRVISVVDLRVRLGLRADFGERTCIVVSHLETDDGRPLQIGLIVDGVEDVVTLASADIEAPPEFGTKVENAYLLGMAKVKGQLKLLLDLDRVLGA